MEPRTFSPAVVAVADVAAAAVASSCHLVVASSFHLVMNSGICPCTAAAASWVFHFGRKGKVECWIGL